jgi:hypothetical protein
MQRAHFVILLTFLAPVLAALRGINRDPTNSTRALQLTAGSQAGSRVINGIAHTLMEDHFDIGAHFMNTIVETEEGERIKVDFPHHRAYTGERVSWVIHDKTPSERLATKKANQQAFSERWGSCVFVTAVYLALTASSALSILSVS